MMSITHMMLAKELYEHIYLMYGIPLKKKSLIYGSMKPDVTTLFAKHPHYIDKSLDMLCERIEALRDVVFFDRGVKTRAFARELGVASHYLADFFCRVHNDINGIKHNETMEHIIYEQRMTKRITQSDLDVIREKSLDWIASEIDVLEQLELRQYLLLQHQRYMEVAGKEDICDNRKKQYEIDMEYALKIILVVCSDICKGRSNL